MYGKRAGQGFNPHSCTPSKKARQSPYYARDGTPGAPNVNFAGTTAMGNQPGFVFSPPPQNSDGPFSPFRGATQGPFVPFGSPHETTFHVHQHSPGSDMDVDEVIVQVPIDHQSLQSTDFQADLAVANSHIKEAEDTEREIFELVQASDARKKSLEDGREGAQEELIGAHADADEAARIAETALEKVETAAKKVKTFDDKIEAEGTLKQTYRDEIQKSNLKLQNAQSQKKVLKYLLDTPPHQRCFAVCPLDAIRETMPPSREACVRLSDKKARKLIVAARAQGIEHNKEFQAFWDGKPPDGYSPEQWREKYGKQPRISVSKAKAPEKLADYLGYPTFDFVANAAAQSASEEGGEDSQDKLDEDDWFCKLSSEEKRSFRQLYVNSEASSTSQSASSSDLPGNDGE